MWERRRPGARIHWTRYCCLLLLEKWLYLYTACYYLLIHIFLTLSGFLSISLQWHEGERRSTQLCLVMDFNVCTGTSQPALLMRTSGWFLCLLPNLHIACRKTARDITAYFSAECNGKDKATTYLLSFYWHLVSHRTFKLVSWVKVLLFD